MKCESQKASLILDKGSFIYCLEATDKAAQQTDQSHQECAGEMGTNITKKFSSGSQAGQGGWGSVHLHGMMEPISNERSGDSTSLLGAGRSQFSSQAPRGSSHRAVEVANTTRHSQDKMCDQPSGKLLTSTAATEKWQKWRYSRMRGCPLVKKF